MTLTPSQLQTLRETGSVRVVVPNERWAVSGSWNDSTDDLEINNNITHYRVWRWSQCMNEDSSEKFNTDFLGRWRVPETMPSPFPSPGTIETIDGMECEWMERGCKQVGSFTEDEIKESSMGPTSGIELLEVFQVMDEDVYVWTATLRRKDEGDER